MTLIYSYTHSGIIFPPTLLFFSLAKKDQKHLSTTKHFSFPFTLLAQFAGIPAFVPSRSYIRAPNRESDRGQKFSFVWYQRLGFKCRQIWANMSLSPSFLPLHPIPFVKLVIACVPDSVANFFLIFAGIISPHSKNTLQLVQ